MSTRGSAKAQFIKHRVSAAVFAAFLAVAALLSSLPLQAETENENYEAIARELLGGLLSKINKLSELKGLPEAKLTVKEIMPKLIHGKYFIAKIDHPSICQVMELGTACPYYVVSLNSGEPLVLIERSAFEIYFVGMGKNGRPMFKAEGKSRGSILFDWRDGAYVEGEEMLP